MESLLVCRANDIRRMVFPLSTLHDHGTSHLSASLPAMFDLCGTLSGFLTGSVRV
jgi:hypothetical protein